MSRLLQITEREQLPEDQRHHYDSIIASRKQIGPPYYYLLHCPDLAARTAHLVGYSRFDSDLPNKVKEVAICTVARELDCVFEWAAHEGLARDAGISEATITAIKERKAPEGTSEREAQIVTYVQEILRSPHRVSDSTFAALRHQLGDAQLADLTGSISAYAALACSLNAFGVQAPEGTPVLPT